MLKYVPRLYADQSVGESGGIAMRLYERWAAGLPRQPPTFSLRAFPDFASQLFGLLAYFGVIS